MIWAGFHHAPAYDDWWKARSAIERVKDIKVPVLSIGHQGKMGLHERGNILAMRNSMRRRS